MDFQLTAEQRKIQEVCRRLAADFATRASQHDRETSAPLENYTALQEAGLYSAVVPKEFGGWGSGFLGWVLVAEELAQGCPATALSFNMHAVAVGGLFDHPDTPPAIKQQVASLVVQEQKLLAIAVSETGTSSLMMLATIAPTVQAHRVKGGYQLRGRKTFVSMVEACNYSLLFAHPAEDTNQLAGVLMLVPRSAAGQRIEEVWDTLGMRGTRSNDLVLEDCFIPDHDVLLTVENVPAWVSHVPQWLAGGGITAVYLGVGVAAYRHAREILTHRIPRGFTQPLSYHPDIRRRVAEMSVDVEAARWVMYHAAWLVDTVGMTPEARAALLRAEYLVGEMVARVTRSALTACGAHALFKTSPLERLFRDGASAPIMPPSSDSCLNGLGILELGLTPAEILPPLKVAK